MVTLSVTMHIDGAECSPPTEELALSGKRLLGSETRNIKEMTE